MKRRVLGSAAIVLTFACVASAQQPSTRPLQTQGQRASDSAVRARLEGEIRRGFARAVRQRVGLTDDQMSRLGPVAMRYEQQRRQLQMDERDARLSLRASLRNEQTADAKQVDQQLQRLLDIQKRRLQLLETEQRDLATIMTPLQRAKYMALQEQIKRRLEQMRQRRMQLFEGEMGETPAPARRPIRRPPL